MEENTTPLNNETGSDFAAIDQTMESAPNVEQENAEISQIETPEEPSEVDKIRQEKENLLEALRQEREERKRYREELEAARSQIPVYKTPEQQEREQQEAEAKRVLKELGVMTKDEWEQMSRQDKENWEREQREEKDREAINKEVEDLAKEFDGQNGKPKFDKNKLKSYLEYGQQNKIFNIRAAFKDMHFAELAASYANNPNKPTTFATQSSVQKGGGLPDFSKMTSDQIWEWQKSQGLAQR